MISSITEEVLKKEDILRQAELRYPSGTAIISIFNIGVEQAIIDWDFIKSNDTAILFVGYNLYLSVVNRQGNYYTRRAFIYDSEAKLWARIDQELMLEIARETIYKD